MRSAPVPVKVRSCGVGQQPGWRQRLGTLGSSPGGALRPARADLRAAHVVTPPRQRRLPPSAQRSTAAATPTAWNAGFSRRSPPQAGGGTDLMRRDGAAARPSTRVSDEPPAALRAAVPAEAGVPSRRAFRLWSPTRSAGLRPACRLKPAFQAVRAAVAPGCHAEGEPFFSGGVTTCAARSAARAGRRAPPGELPSVPSRCAFRPWSPTRSAGLRPACRLKPAFQAGVPPWLRVLRRGRAVFSGWGYDVRSAERCACRSETGVPSRRATVAPGCYAEGGAVFSGWGCAVRSAERCACRSEGPTGRTAQRSKPGAAMGLVSLNERKTKWQRTSGSLPAISGESVKGGYPLSQKGNDKSELAEARLSARGSFDLRREAPGGSGAGAQLPSAP